ncbi:Hypothetical protein, putative [Bodo saltans]|uniref:C3H1-type domain-containing protein n=1 Tax=Bodo saltans TaxID=75058 RepID=A0A0S4ILK5_BODSA|nr:Hypothetical protein, putative [Bodo saltans]|eukprot:CUF26217.1 Hypothetical protein, putative [Bodo saltans]
MTALKILTFFSLLIRIFSSFPSPKGKRVTKLNTAMSVSERNTAFVAKNPVCTEEREPQANATPPQTEPPGGAQTDADETFADPPYNREYLLKRGGVLWTPLGSTLLHPCTRPDFCGGARCEWAAYPRGTCFDFARRGFCGRKNCTAAHIVAAQDGALFVIRNKHIKLNGTMSRLQVAQVLAAKAARLDLARKRIREVAEVRLDVVEATNSVDSALLRGEALRTLNDVDRLQALDSSSLLARRM